MTEATLPETPETEEGESSSILESVIRIAGNSQDGIQSIGGFLARLAGRSEQEVMTFMTIPSTISGGPSVFQVRIGSGEVLSAGDEADVLLAFYDHSYRDHYQHLKSGGLVLFDSDHVEIDDAWAQESRHVGVPISSLTVEAIGGAGRDKGKNLFALGLISSIFQLDQDKLVQLLNEKFGGKGSGVLENALGAFHAGAGYDLGPILQTMRFAKPERRERGQIVCSGNEALAYGLIAAGVRFGAGYPITPWSDIMEALRRELPKYGGSFIQCEDEIAAVSMALGASWAGNVAVTGSSGPGIALKSEAIGWGVMAEIPLVVCDIQRGGPSTGLPTNVEQSDLNIACFGGHGDSPRVVLAPGHVGDCFYTALEAVRIAREYSVPVIILSDQSIATRIEAFAEPDLEKEMRDISPKLETLEDHKPYDLEAENGVPDRAPPGTRIMSGRYPVVTGLEHDEMGHPSGAPEMHRMMTTKRRRKMQALAESLPSPKIHGAQEGSVLLIGWGSTRGPIREAVNKANAAGKQYGCFNIRHINPLCNGLEEIFSRFERVFVVEMNDGGIYGYGQFCALLRARFCDPKIEGINKCDGLTWRVADILAEVESRLG